MTLALMMGRTERELLESLTPQELDDWKAYAVVSPFGPDVTELQRAMVCQTVALSGGVKNPSRVTLERFMPSRANEPRVQSPRQMKLAAQAWVASVNRQKKG